MEIRRELEKPLVKTKIIATVGPACQTIETLRELIVRGVDLFRINFAHAMHDWLRGILTAIRTISDELGRPVGVLGDLAGPKIRLGELPEEGIICHEGATFEFVRELAPQDPTKLTSTYGELIDDLKLGDRILLADGLVAMRVAAKPPARDRVVCVVERAGRIRSRQGINLPGVKLRVPSLTTKDHEDLAWAIENELDYVGLSFVRGPDDISALRTAMAGYRRAVLPAIVAKIEKMEAVSALEAILQQTDAVMVARGDLGVEVDVALVPGIQKRIIRRCNQHGVPVITATQMLESMQKSEMPTRAEASDVANAVLDGSDAIMLSGETAVGDHPALVVATMSRIAFEAERLLRGRHRPDDQQAPQSRAQPVTESVTVAARAAAEHLAADLLVVASRSGKTAMAMSSQRSSVPILALSDRPDTARRMCLYWGVTALETQAMRDSPQALLAFAVAWGRTQGVLKSGNRVVLVGTTDWNANIKDLMLVHMVP